MAWKTKSGKKEKAKKKKWFWMGGGLARVKKKL